MISDPVLRERKQDAGKDAVRQDRPALASFAAPAAFFRMFASIQSGYPAFRWDGYTSIRYPLVCLTHCTCPGLKLVLVLVDVGGVDGEERFFVLELPEIAAVLPVRPPRQRDVLAVPRGDRPLLVPRLLGARVVQVFPQSGHFLGRAAPHAVTAAAAMSVNPTRTRFIISPLLSGLRPDAKNPTALQPERERLLFIRQTPSWNKVSKLRSNVEPRSPLNAIYINMSLYGKTNPVYKTNGSALLRPLRPDGFPKLGRRSVTPSQFRSARPRFSSVPLPQ